MQVKKIEQNSDLNAINNFITKRIDELNKKIPEFTNSEQRLLRKRASVLTEKREAFIEIQDEIMRLLGVV